ncbi:MAG TPA: FAD-dependent oxidoreductase, partial [Candidatus Nanopelagicales bacterium]|nr:FAD-dependent oxidoreductase [Candidatus Nanopelagicales bacterium]
MKQAGKRPHVVIVGGGFGGLNAAKALGGAAVDVTLVDRTNHHLFQPLLYQVAMAGLSGPDIASPIRQVLRSQRN